MKDKHLLIMLFIIFTLIATSVYGEDTGPVVTIASSKDLKLSSPVPLDAEITYKQVDEILRLTLDRDTSPHSIRNVIKPEDWVVIKPNMVTSRSNPHSNYWFEGEVHNGQLTDLRVIKSLIGYLIEKVGPRRISIAEGGAEWMKLGEKDTPPEQTEDCWTICYPAFDNLSYVDIVNYYQPKGGQTKVDIVDLSYDEARFVPVPDPHNSGIRAYQWKDAEPRPIRFGYSQYIPGTGTLRDGYWIPVTILECDKLICCPVMKTHSPGVTLVLKNYVGIIHGRSYGYMSNTKAEIHKGDLVKGYVDLFCYHPADYSIIEGFYSTEGNGPQWGWDIRRNVIIAGADPLATEAVACAAMGFNPEDMEPLILAAAKGFGTYYLDEINTVGASIEDVRLDFIQSWRDRHGYLGRRIRKWLICGPFDGASLSQEFIRGEGKVVPSHGVKAGSGKTWRFYESPENYIDLTGQLKDVSDEATVYAFSQVESDRARYGYIRIGCADGCKLWFNGKLVLEDENLGPFDHRKKDIPVVLKKGINTLIFKVINRRDEENEFGFAAGITNYEGDRLFGTKYGVGISGDDQTVR